MDALLKLCEPYFHLTIGEKSDFMRLYLQYKKAAGSSNTVLLINGKKCSNKNKLFKEFVQPFQFPGYFGYNWDAFEECLNDLSWLPSKSYILFLSDINAVLGSYDNDFNIFIDLLVDTIDKWTNGRNCKPEFPKSPTPFHIVFQCVQEHENKVKVKLKQAGLEVLDTFLI